MNEVSCRALGMVFDGLTRMEIPHKRLVELQHDLEFRAAPTKRVVLQLARGARRPTWIEAALTDGAGEVRWDWAHTPAPVGPLELLISAPEGAYQLRVATDTGLAVTSAVGVSAEDREALWLTLDE